MQKYSTLRRQGEVVIAIHFNQKAIWHIFSSLEEEQQLYDEDFSDCEVEDEDTSPDYLPSEEEFEDDVIQEESPYSYRDAKYIVSSF